MAELACLRNPVIIIGAIVVVVVIVVVGMKMSGNS